MDTLIRIILQKICLGLLMVYMRR